jgi:hypothetical protein
MDTSSKGVNLQVPPTWSGRVCAFSSGSVPGFGMRLLWDFCLLH